MDVRDIVVNFVGNATGFLKTVEQVTKASIDLAGKLTGVLGKAINSSFGTIPQMFGKIAGGIAGGIANATKALPQQLGGMASSFATGFKNLMANLGHGSVGDAVSRAYASFMGGSFVRGLRLAFTHLTQGSAATAVRGMIQGSVGQMFGQMLSAIPQTLAGVVGGAGKFVGSLASGALGIFGGLLSGVLGAAASVVTTALSSLLSVTISLTTQTIQLAAAYEMAEASFIVMAGSVEKGKDLLQSVVSMAIETPFTSPELIAGAKQLKAFGFETEEIIPTLHVMGDVSSGTERDLQKLIHAFGQTREQGKLMGYQLREFTAAGVPLMENLAEVMDRPVTSMRKLVREGMVGYPQVVMAFNRMTGEGGLFYEMMEKQSRTVMGRWNALKENVENLMRAVGLALFKGFGLADLLDQWGTDTANLSKQVGNLEETFTRIRKAFDVFTAAGKAVGQTMAEIFGANGALDFSQAEGFAVRLVETLVSALSQLMAFLQKIAVFILENIVTPILKATNALGLGSSSGGGPTSFYEGARARGMNKATALFYSLGGNVGTLIGDRGARIESGRYARNSPGVQDVKKVADAVKSVDFTPNDFLKKFQEYRDKQQKDMIDRAIRMPVDQSPFAGAGQDFLVRYAESVRGLRGGEKLPDAMQDEVRKVLEDYQKRATRLWYDAYLEQSKVEENFYKGIGLPLSFMDKDRAASKVANQRVRDSFPFANLPSDQGPQNILAASIPGMTEYVEKARKAFQALVPYIPSPESMKAFQETAEQYEKGATAVEQFGNQVRLLKEAAGGVGVNLPFFGQQRVAPWAEGAGDPEKIRQFGIYQAYQNLKKSLPEMSDKEAALPAAVSKGTAEAAKIINESMTQTRDVQEDILDVLKRAKEEAEKQTKEMKRVADAIDKAFGKPGVFRVEEIF